MPRVICAWLNCKHNSFIPTNEMKEQVKRGLVLLGSGECLVNKKINLSLEENEEEFLVCDNYEDSSKFDG